MLSVFADEYDAYIIVSFVNATLVLSIGETVEEVTDSGFLGTTPTLGCSSLGDNTLLQVLLVVLVVCAVCFTSSSTRCTPRAFGTFAQTGGLTNGSRRVRGASQDAP